MAAGDVQPHADAMRAAAAPPAALAPAGDAALTPVATDRIVSGFYLRYGKRVFDVVCATALLLVALPLIAGVAIVVLVTSGWPVIYRSSRQGLDGRPFRMWKFRTMIRDAEALSERWSETHPALAQELRTTWKLERDPRITRVGSFLRRSSLDELPQLVHVLRGEMSLVGPRPKMPDDHEPIDATFGALMSPAKKT